ncbi:MAG: site-2 protease family protein [Ignavibacteriae bacterium]|nr:site-2 protease family protein [Ignavibacteria bacterium]MBI3364781.1 site-2 protease family protein [Ignavibacteriota bacterium]
MLNSVKSRNLPTYLIHTLLFTATFFTTTLAGVQWLNRDPLELVNFKLGLPYSLSLITILAAHEFGHYFAARYHKVDSTLPFFIPFPPLYLFPLANPFGTMGAVIRIRSPLSSNKALFDIGIAGPIAGLFVTMLVLLYGFINLPPREFLFTIHPQYQALGKIPEEGLTFGDSIFFYSLRLIFGSSTFVPPMNEVYHYPFLCVGWFGLLITAINLVPIGQLDGGHVLYSLVRNWQGKIARFFFGFLIFVGLLSVVPYFGADIQPATIGWLVFAAILFFIIKLDHPQIHDLSELSIGRRILGWTTMIIFLLIFPPIPFYGLSPK